MLVTQEQLLELTGLRQKAALRRHLKAAGVPFKEIAGRILTTEDALTASMVANRGKKKRRKEPNWDACH